MFNIWKKKDGQLTTLSKVKSVSVLPTSSKKKERPQCKKNFRMISLQGMRFYTKLPEAINLPKKGSEI